MLSTCTVPARGCGLAGREPDRARSPLASAMRRASAEPGKHGCILRVQQDRPFPEMDTFVSIAIAIAAIDTPSSRGNFARQAAGGHGWGGPPSPLKKFTMRHMVPPTTPTAGAGPAPPTVPKLMDMRTRPRPLLCTQHQSQFYAGHQTAPISPKYF